MTRQSSRLKKPIVEKTTTTKPAKSKPTKEIDENEEDPSIEDPKTTKKRKVAQSYVKEEDDDEEEEEEEAVVAEKPKAVKKRKTTKAKKEDSMVLAQRTVVSTLKKSMYIGAHVSSAGGVQNSIPNAVNIGANAFALFLKPHRKWVSPPMTKEAISGFNSQAQEHKFQVCNHCLPHGSYLVNLAQADKDKAQQAHDAFVDDLMRCESLGIKLYNFHPGSTGGDTKANAIGRIAAQLNKAHGMTSNVVTVLENMAGQGNVIGSAFEDLRDIIELIDDKSRVGVCIDTCHTFAAGYDLRTPEAFEATMSEFDKIVGYRFLKALHLNDSKAPLDSHRDLHANIGTGFLGLRAFHSVMNHAPFEGLPMVLETPIDKPAPDGNGKAVEDKQVWADEIKLLESLIGMDPDSDEFKAHDARLQKEGLGERNLILKQVERKAAVDAGKSKRGSKPKKTTTKRGAKGKKAEVSEDEDDSD